MAVRKSPQGRSRRRDSAAVAASLGAHLLVLWLILGSASGDLVPSGDNVGNGAGGGGGDPLMTVSLVDPTTPMAAPAQDASAAASAAVEDLFKRLVVPPPPQAAVFVSPPEKTSLDEVLGKAQAKSGGSSAGQAQTRPAPGQHRGADTAQAGPARSGATASSGSLFGMIEPCWRKQPGVSRVLVKLELTLGGDGRLALPPKIIRTSQMVLDDQQFFAEARALNALKACLPLRGGAATGVQQVEFRPDRPGH